MFNNIKNTQLNKEEIRKLDDIFWNQFSDVAVREESIKKLFEYFIQSTKQKIEIHYWSYWRYFCELCFKDLNKLNREQIEFVFSHQIPMAILLGVDVLKSMFLYLQTNSYDQTTCTIKVRPIRVSFFESIAVLGKDQNKEYTINELITEAKRLVNMGSRALDLAEFKDKLKRIFTSNISDTSDEYIGSPDLMVTYFNDLMQFFIGVEDKKVFYIIDSYFNPENYGMIRGGDQGDGADENNRDKQKEKTIKTDPVDSKPSYDKIVSEIKSQFTFDTNDQTTDFGAVFSRLDELSKKYNDPTIAELYYYDENSGQFKWHTN